MTWAENKSNILVMVETPRPAVKETIPEKRTFRIIQGGMGAGVSDWRLARAVAMAGEKLNEPVLGVVSGTGLPSIMIGRIHNGDRNTIDALSVFDEKTGLEIGKKIVDKYTSNKSYSSPKPEYLVLKGIKPEAREEENNLAIASAFVEVWLAKQGHSGSIGINLLEKIQLMHLPTILGAMLADVDYLLMGAGIPTQVPQLLNDFANGRTASYRLEVEDVPEKPSKEFLEQLEEKATIRLDPTRFMSKRKQLKKPRFFPIISSNLLAELLIKKVKVDGEVGNWIDGFIVEGPLAGGHNSPPRVKNVFNERGEPVYGKKDEVDLGKLRELGKPFYLAGAQATPEKFNEAQNLGAAGVQIGSFFAASKESGLRPDLKQQLIERIIRGDLDVFADPNASPSGYPFNVVQLPNTLSDEEVFDNRTRVCSAGYLRHAYRRLDGEIGFRCPAENVADYVKKGGKIADTEGSKCLCEGLLATAGFPRLVPDGHGHRKEEPPIVTFGKDYQSFRDFITSRNGSITAEDIVRHLTSQSPR